MHIITLLTDFGWKDGYQGIMKGVIWKIAPGVPVADITHGISAQNVMEGALMLQRVAPQFPTGTIHVAVVDPGVGTQRRPIAARLGEYFFVGPDNGLVSALWNWAEERGAETAFFHLDQPRFWLAEISNVFHGRDIFAPAAAHLAAGSPLEALGSPIQDAVHLAMPRVERIPGGWRGQVISADCFGNLSTNIQHCHLENMAQPCFQICGKEITGMVHTFGDRPKNELVALWGTGDDLMIAVVEGSARDQLQAQVGAIVEVKGGV